MILSRYLLASAFSGLAMLSSLAQADAPNVIRTPAPIKMLNQETPGPETQLEGCKFIEGEKASHWTLEISYRLKELYWEGQRLIRLDSTTDRWLNPEQIDGYVYRPGDYVKREARAEAHWDGSDFYIDYYYICREKL